MSTRITVFDSPGAAGDLVEAIEAGEVTLFSFDADDWQGATDCPDGCVVEPDGICRHGWRSAALTARLV